METVDVAEQHYSGEARDMVNGDGETFFTAKGGVSMDLGNFDL
jgi:hypothetical protein